MINAQRVQIANLSPTLINYSLILSVFLFAEDSLVFIYIHKLKNLAAYLQLKMLILIFLKVKFAFSLSILTQLEFYN